uniref:Uncharacterized protein n=1 Tax=Spongospora subterranea TaxID=70186 RepID=A0A0H5RC97_9EUKA|eukprot:CRZ11663.1 hypothetical protein [Spongospora subterranea]
MTVSQSPQSLVLQSTSRQNQIKQVLSVKLFLTQIKVINYRREIRFERFNWDYWANGEGCAKEAMIRINQVLLSHESFLGAFPSVNHSNIAAATWLSVVNNGDENEEFV